jgi:hypothetical protein
MIRHSMHGAARILPVAILTLIAVAGCGRHGGPPGTIRVTGTVTYDGRPLPTGAVHFVADSGAGGSTRLQAGRFQLFLAPGHYRLAVIATDGVETIDPKTGGMKPGNFLIPERYATVDTSGLTATIDREHSSVICTLAK